MLRLSVAATAAFMLLSISACSRDSGPTLTAPDAYARAQAGTLTLIDVRPPEEWRQTGVAQGALRIDMASANGEAGFIRQVSAGPATRAGRSASSAAPATAAPMPSGYCAMPASPTSITSRKA